MRDNEIGSSPVTGGSNIAQSRALRCIAALLLCLSVTTSQVRAQTQNDASIIGQILQSAQQPGQAGVPSVIGQSGSTTQGSPQVQPSYSPPQSQSQSQQNIALPRSRLEQIMSARAGVRLQQFGYDQFGVPGPVNVPQSGALLESYILGPGDEIVVSLRGQDNSEFRAVVDRGGSVLLPRLSPILAAGRTLADFRRDVLDAVHRAYISTQAFVTIGALRQVSVMVSGEVNNPGMRIVNGLSSAADVILLSGGVKKTGSLRNIRIIRHGRSLTVDLYSLLTDRGRGQTALLTDGDRVVVPPLGSTVAIVGWVRRPGIYEIAPGSGAISTRTAIRMAGGTEVRGKYRLSLMRVGSNGASQLENVSENSIVRDSEILFVQPGVDQVESQATLSGGSALAGQYSLGKAGSLAEMLNSPGALGENSYSLFGIISRQNSATLLRELVPFTPIAVLHGKENIELQSNDVVRVISAREARLLSAVVHAFKQRRTSAVEVARAPTSSENLTSQVSPADAQQLVKGPATTDAGNTQTTPWFLQANGGIKDEREDIAELSTMVLGEGGVLVPSSRASSGSPPQEQYAQNFEDQELRSGEVPLNREVKTFGDFAKQLRTDPLVLMYFLMDHEASIGGAVRGAGDYFVGPDVNLNDLVTAAGGTAGWADNSGVEVISTAVDGGTGRSETSRMLLPLHSSTLANYVVKPHDEIRFNQIYATVGAGSVTLQGEVRSPGTYKIEKGEHLSELLLRAGGLADQAYPYGTVFLRKSVAAIEADGYRRAADEMENMLLTSGTQFGTQAASAAGVQALITDLRSAKPLGRISIVADPVQLVAHPQRDPLLEAGDVIYIPQRPSTVTILGQVLQPGTVPYASKMTAADYIDQMGGYNDFADKSLVFVVLPNGTARRLEASWFNLNDEDIPPGSTIVVPRDLSPISIRQVITDVTGVLSQAAVSVATAVFLVRN